MRNVLIVGASRGLGAALSADVLQAGDTAWLVSRSRPATVDLEDDVARHWLPLDLQAVDAGDRLAAALGDRPLDALIYNAGLWESTAFSAAYDFASTDPAENARIVQVNLQAAIACCQALLPHLRRARAAKVILIGSISAAANAGAPEVAYVASKFGLRGLAQALRAYLRPEGIAVTCLNPGTIATEIPYSDGIEPVLRQFGGCQLPMHDVVAVARCLLALSPAACAREIDLPAIAETWA